MSDISKFLPVTAFSKKTGKVDKEKTKSIRANNKATAKVQRNLADQPLRTVDREISTASQFPKKEARNRRTAGKTVLKRRVQGKSEKP